VTTPAYPPRAAAMASANRELAREFSARQIDFWLVPARGDRVLALG
jgi:hypothetical protein